MSSGLTVLLMHCAKKKREKITPLIAALEDSHYTRQARALGVSAISTSR